VICPQGREYFSAFDHPPIDQVKVVILGQDLYHGPQQAHGLALSVPLSGIAVRPALSSRQCLPERAR
jgi:uracil-DNA glycosylase